MSVEICSRLPSSDYFILTRPTELCNAVFFLREAFFRALVGGLAGTSPAVSMRFVEIVDNCEE